MSVRRPGCTVSETDPVRGYTACYREAGHYPATPHAFPTAHVLGQEAPMPLTKTPETLTAGDRFAHEWTVGESSLVEVLRTAPGTTRDGLGHEFPTVEVTVAVMDAAGERLGIMRGQERTLVYWPGTDVEITR